MTFDLHIHLKYLKNPSIIILRFYLKFEENNLLK